MTVEEFTRRFWVGTSPEIAERLQPVVDAGIDHAIFSMPRLAYDLRPMHQFAREIIPRFASSS